MSANKNTTLGLIIGNRDFFPDKLVGEARAEIVKLFASLNITPVLLNETESKLGGVETFSEAKNVQHYLSSIQMQLTGYLWCFQILEMRKVWLKQSSYRV